VSAPKSKSAACKKQTLFKNEKMLLVAGAFLSLSCHFRSPQIRELKYPPTSGIGGYFTLAV
jgi:hypothetical protein